MQNLRLGLKRKLHPQLSSLLTLETLLLYKCEAGCFPFKAQQIVYEYPYPGSDKQRFR